MLQDETEKQAETLRRQPERCAPTNSFAGSAGRDGVLLGLMTLLVATPEPVEARGTKTKKCSAEATRNLNEAKKFIIDNLRIFQTDFELNERSKKERRIRDRMRSKVNKIKFSCAKKVLCRDGQGQRSGFHGSGILGNKIRICWERVTRKNYSFCALASTVTHEFGHSVGIPKGRRHSKNKNDKVYQFGNFAKHLCLHQGRDRKLEDPSVSNPWSAPATGIGIYPKKNYRGWSITLNDSQPELRDLGRNDAISSVRVKSGRWQLCTKKNYGGKCKIWTDDDPDLSKSKFNNKVSSIRMLP